MLPDFQAGTLVKLNGAGRSLQRKLIRSGGIAFAGNHLTVDEAGGTFVWLGHDDGRDARVRSVVSGREDQIFRGMFRKA